MIDLHAHILSGLDDGIKTFQDSVAIIKEAKAAGFEKIVCTTHNSSYYNANEAERMAKIEELRKANLGVELILGNEIYARLDMADLIESKEASTINNTKYVLFEIPLSKDYPELKNVIMNLVSKGYRLILAHPERYIMFQKNPKMIEEVIEAGVYLQSNYMSIEGWYGKEAKKLVELLYKHNMITFLGTDAHSIRSIYPAIPKTSKKIIDMIGEEKFNELSDSNIRAVLNNEEIELADYEPIVKGFLGSYK